MAYYLIAGAAGYVGSRLTQQLLDNGHHVRGLVLSPESDTVEMLAARGMSVWIGDITRPETLDGIADGIDHVINLTGQPAVDDELTRKIFIDGNQNLIAACSRNRSLQTYLFTSNVAPYGDCGADLVDEDRPVAPTCRLGDVMVAAEQVLVQAIRTHRFPAIILRVAHIYGPERDLVDAVHEGMVTIYGDGHNYVSHIHIDDLLNALQRAAEQGEPGAIYNIGDDEPIPQINLIGEVRHALGMVPPRTYSSAAALRAGIAPNVVNMLSASVRLANARMKHDLALELRYPSYRVYLAERFATSAIAVGA
jgi:nucleoside-diphosphate-sugar epimerase